MRGRWPLAPIAGAGVCGLGCGLADMAGTADGLEVVEVVAAAQRCRDDVIGDVGSVVPHRRRAGSAAGETPRINASFT